MTSEDKSFSSLNEMHESIEKIETELLKAKVEHKRELKYKAMKKKKLIEKIEEMRERFEILQGEVGRKNTEKQILENKIKIDINEEAGKNEFEMIKREVEIRKGRLKNCEKYRKILKKGIGSLIHQYGECNESDQVQKIQLSDEGSSSTSSNENKSSKESSSSESSSKDSVNAEILNEDKPTQLSENVELADISIPTEVIRPTFEDLTDSKRIKQLMDDLSSLVSHRDKVFSP